MFSHAFNGLELKLNTKLDIDKQRQIDKDKPKTYWRLLHIVSSSFAYVNILTSIKWGIYRLRCSFLAIAGQEKQLKYYIHWRSKSFLRKSKCKYFLLSIVWRNYYYYYLLLWVFHISVSWWFFTGVWVTESLLKSPGLFSVFWPFSIM